MRVSHIVSGDLWAGAEVMIYHLLQGLRARPDLHLTAIILNEGRLSEEVRKLGIRVWVVDENNVSFFTLLLAIRKILCKEQPDVIHSHRYKENILSCLASRHFGKKAKLMCTYHGLPELSQGSSSALHRWVTKSNFLVLSQCFHRVVAVSREIENFFIKHHKVRKDRVCVVHNGVVVPPFSSDRATRGRFVIGSAGRLFPVKDYSFMVEIAQKVVEMTCDIHFQLAGDGPERERIEANIMDRDLGEVFELRGHLEDVSDFYRGLDVYLNTSVHEGIPMSILEAMAHGVPVVAPRIGGISEIIDEGVNGYLLDARDPKKFAQRILELRENEPLRRDVALAARQKVMKEFSIDRMVNQYFKLYHSIVE